MNKQAITPDGKHKMAPPEVFIKIDASPEEVAQALFANARPPDPSRRIHNLSKERERAYHASGRLDPRHGC